MIWYKTKKKGTCAWTDTNHLTALESDSQLCGSHASTEDTTFASTSYKLTRRLQRVLSFQVSCWRVWSVCLFQICCRPASFGRYRPRSSGDLEDALARCYHLRLQWDPLRDLSCSPCSSEVGLRHPSQTHSFDSPLSVSLETP